MKKRGRKFGNVKVEIDGHTFDSHAEGARYLQLRAKLQRGEITGLKIHPKFDLHGMNGKPLGITWSADFQYLGEGELGAGKLTIEDVKGVATQLYKLKKAVFEAQSMGVKVTEIPAKDLAGDARRLKQSKAMGVPDHKLTA